MFTGIIETIGIVKSVIQDAGNVHFIIQSEIATELKIDQSIAHNGVCLTVVELLNDNCYKVTAIHETLQKTNLGKLKSGVKVNLERCLSFNGRIDGHIVQGHVDGTATCVDIKEEDGSWVFTIRYADEFSNLIVNKGSVCVNGVSLTVVDPTRTEFSVAIIPYTYSHTNFSELKVGDSVNLEFDIIGKYLARHLENATAIPK